MTISANNVGYARGAQKPENQHNMPLTCNCCMHQRQQ